MGAGTYLTNASNYLVDWNRPGSLFFGRHRYSTKELAERGFVIAMTSIAGYWAWSQSQSPMYAAAAATIGFLVAHTITMSPLICKRLEAKWACDALIIDIRSHVNDKPEFQDLVNSVIEKVMQYAQSKSASAVWGERKRLLTHLSEWVRDVRISIDDLSAVLKRDDVISCLDNQNFDDVVDGGLVLRVR